MTQVKQIDDKEFGVICVHDKKPVWAATKRLIALEECREPPASTLTLLVALGPMYCFRAVRDSPAYPVGFRAKAA